MARGLWIGRPRQRAILEPAADGVDSGARTWYLLQIYDRVSMMRSDVFADCANRVIAIAVVVVGDHIAIIWQFGANELHRAPDSGMPHQRGHSDQTVTVKNC